MQQPKVGGRDDGAKSGDLGDLTLAGWLQRKCDEEHLSLRGAGEKIGVSNGTIASVLRGKRPSVDTIDKLAIAFSSNGQYERTSLKDWMLSKCGYRNNNEKGEMRQPIARLMDKVTNFNDEQLKIMEQFAEFINRSGFSA